MTCTTGRTQWQSNQTYFLPLSDQRLQPDFCCQIRQQLLSVNAGLGSAHCIHRLMCLTMYFAQSESSYSAQCAYGPMCPGTSLNIDWCVHVLSVMCPQTGVPMYSAWCPMDRCVHVHAQPDVSTGWCAHGHSLNVMCPQTDKSMNSAHWEHGLMCSPTQPGVHTDWLYVFSAWCAHGLMCPCTQPHVLPIDWCVHILSQMCPLTNMSCSQPDMPTDWCVHILSPTCPQTDVSTYSARYAHRQMCTCTQPYVPRAWCVHILRGPLCSWT